MLNITVGLVHDLMVNKNFIHGSSVDPFFSSIFLSLFLREIYFRCIAGIILYFRRSNAVEHNT